MAKNKLNKLGIFGGSFNPVHYGHINSVLTVSKRLNLDKVLIVPAYQNPLRKGSPEASPEQRLEMTKLAFKDWNDVAEVDDQEIKRKGKSFTIDTLDSVQEKYPKAELFLICGLDAFDNFDKWKDFDKILKKSNIVVTSRPGSQWPTSTDELPRGVQALVESFSFPDVELRSGKYLFFLPLDDKNVSATTVRKKLRLGQKVDKFLPIQVEDFIRTQDVYPPLKQKITNDKNFVSFCAKTLDDRKGIMFKAFDLRDINAPFQYSMVVSGTNTRHTQALADGLVESVKVEYGLNPVSVEGTEEGRWVVVDYGAFVVHIFYDFVRQEYKLEDLWQKGKEISV